MTVQTSDSTSTSHTLGAVILAAGKGTRMKSAKPKVLHELLHLPMLWYVHQAVLSVVPAQEVWTVVGYGREQVDRACRDYAGHFVHQAEQKGTGHAVQQAWPSLQEAGCEWCLVVNGDAPLVQAQALEDLIRSCREQAAALAFVSIELDDPSGYGRVVRKADGTVSAVVEDKDLSPEQQAQALKEVNAGIYCLHVPTISGMLSTLSDENAQGEYYITELIDLCARNRNLVLAVNAGRDASFLGVNSPAELVDCERLLQDRINAAWMAQGVILRNPQSIRISPLASLGPGTEVTGPAEIYGSSRIGPEVCIRSHVYMQDTSLEAGAEVREFSHLEGAQVGSRCQVGPYARLRPGAQLKAEAKVGNFVEVKKAVLEVGSKVNHLSYIGDATLGQGVNIGAGTITCNYDGRSKHTTTIGKGAFIGSNTALVAPVRVGENSVVGAGSTLTKDVPDNMLALTRSKQKNLRLRGMRTDDE